MTPLPWWAEIYDKLFPVLYPCALVLILTLAGFLIAEGVKLAAIIRSAFDGLFK